MKEPQKPDDLLTARQIADEFGMPLHVAQDLVRNRDRNGKSVRFEGFRRVFVMRKHVMPERTPDGLQR